MLAPGTQYPISEYALLFPDMAQEDYARLLASIGENGLLEPIAVWRGEVIDGRHRLQACAEAGVEPRFSQLEDATDPVEYVLARNEARRHLDDSQRAVAAYKLSAGSRPGPPRQDGEQSANLHNTFSFTQGQAAELLRVSRRNVNYAGKVLAAASPAAPALRRAVERGQIKVSDAANVVGQPAEVQEAALARAASGVAKTLGRAVRQLNSERAEAAEAAAAAANRSKPLDETITLHRAALGDLAKLVAAASVDRIITHPPHGRESLPLLAELAAFAAHALQPSGSLVVLSGMEQLPETLERLKHPDLHWVAEFDYRDNGTTTWSRPPHRTRLRRKSLLVYGKRDFRLPPGDDVIELPPPEPGAEARGQWQLNNAGLELILERFARPGQVICDPIMLGRASAALAARKLGCPFIGADREASSIARVRSYLEGEEVDPAAA